MLRMDEYKVLDFLSEQIYKVAAYCDVVQDFPLTA